MVAKRQSWLVPRLDCRRQKSADHVQVLVIILAKVRLLPATRMFVTGRAAGIFSHAGRWMDRHILPVPVSANDHQVLAAGDEFSQLIAFRFEDFV